MRRLAELKTKQKLWVLKKETTMSMKGGLAGDSIWDKEEEYSNAVKSI